MREIKFRAWDIHKKVFIPTECFAVISTDFSAFGIMVKDWEDYKKDEYFYSTHQTIQQYTGLKDKYSKEIYEGDIVAGKRRGQETIFIGQVTQPKSCWCLAAMHENGYLRTLRTAQFSEFEILGNIYENPELLESEASND